MIVVDASVVVSALVSSDAAGHWAEGILFGCELAAPHLMLIEAANMLRRAQLAGAISLPEAELAHEDLIELSVEFVPHAPLAARASELRENLSIYDASYVALAEELAVPLATLDRRLTRASGPRCPIISP